MSKPKVKIEAKERDRDEGGIVSVEVFVDGESIGDGHFGGEPEDNYEFRDYAWVRPLLRKLAKRLGADVEYVVSPEEDDDEDD